MLRKRSLHFGELIIRLTHTLALNKGWQMKFTMDYVGRRTNYGSDMVYRWQQGNHCKSHETVETLARIGKEEADLPRTWGEDLLKTVHHPHAETVVNGIWGPKPDRHIHNNLPKPDYTAFVGRHDEIARLLELLSPRYGAHLITVDGIGGVGKTALVREVAYRCLRASTGEDPNPKIPTFDAVIFVSAKQQYLTPDGILPRDPSERTRGDIFRTILDTLKPSETTHTVPKDQTLRVREALSRLQTLLIVDNLETMEDRQAIVGFLYELPPTVKVVITTRERVMSFSPIRLGQLAQEEALDLISKGAQEKGVDKDIGKDKALLLYKYIGGVPAALVYAIGQVAGGYSVERVISKVKQAKGDVARFCFEESVRQLREQKAHHLLLAIAMFPKQPLRAGVVATAGLTTDPIAVEEGLAQLQRLSLISLHEERYRMLPLTREYALAELAAYSGFERDARARWIKWYLNLAREYGGEDWDEWRIQYNHIGEEWENLLAVFNWCAAREYYHAMCDFWQSAGVLGVSHVYGYWDDRLTWLNWLIQAAERRGDCLAAVEAMRNRGFTLTMIGQLEEAERLLTEAWQHRECADLTVQVELAQDLALLHIFLKRYDKTEGWLTQSLILLDAAKLEKAEYIRRYIITLFYSGFMYTRKGDYNKAKVDFQEMIEQAESIGSQRAVTYAQNFFADFARAEGQLDHAEQLLQTGLAACESNKDKRHSAFFKRSLARLYKKWGKPDIARSWAQEALDGFESLKMQSEANLMRELIQHI